MSIACKEGLCERFRLALVPEKVVAIESDLFVRQESELRSSSTPPETVPLNDRRQQQSAEQQKRN
jgi:hypothetical protein